MPWPTILYVLLLDWVMVVCGLVGALVKTSYKWGKFISLPYLPSIPGLELSVLRILSSHNFPNTYTDLTKHQATTLSAASPSSV